MKTLGDIRRDGLQLHRAHSQPIRDFVVLGERSTGTHLLDYFAKRSLGLKPSNSTPWKHGFPQFTSIPNDTLVLVSFRALLPWLKSMYAKPWHCPPEMYEQGFSAFIRQEWKTIVDRPQRFFGLPKRRHQSLPLLPDRSPLTGEPFANLLKLRNAKNRSFLGLQNFGCNCAFLRLETMNETPVQVMLEIANFFEIEGFKPLPLPDHNLVAVQSPEISERRSEVTTISDDDLAFIADQIDPKIEAQLGYS